MPIARPYKVIHEQENKRRLVVAGSPAQAIRHVSSGWKAEPASALEVAMMISEEGIKCEDATGGAPKEDAGADSDDAEVGGGAAPADGVVGTAVTENTEGGVLTGTVTAPEPAPAPAAA